MKCLPRAINQPGEVEAEIELASAPLWEVLPNIPARDDWRVTMTLNGCALLDWIGI